MVDLFKMKAPGDPRPTWRNGIIQVHVTRACDLSCVGCTQGSNLAGKPTIISVENFEQAVWSLRDYYGVVGIFGGNPTMHPKFDHLCEILQKWIPFERRGLWSNNLNGKGKICRETFNPEVSNLNMHCSESALAEFKRDWPESKPFGMTDSRHSPPYVAMKDMEDLNADQMARMIERCDINQLWSAMICQFRGELRAFFCEIAGAQSMLHEHEEDYPDTGVDVVDGWWKKSMFEFEHQVKKHCYECGIPLKGMGDLANTGKKEYVSKTHLNIYRMKKSGKELHIASSTKDLDGFVRKATDYITNGDIPVESVSKKSVLVGIPTGEHSRYALFQDARAQLQLPSDAGIYTPHGQSPARNRNLIIAQAIKMGYESILFLDDDLQFAPNAYFRLAAHNKDMVTGLYLMRNYPHQPIAFSSADERGRCKWFYPEHGQEGLVPVVAAGLGCALIKTQVFIDMIPYCELTEMGHYDWIRLGQLERDHWCDDIDFWRRARELGYQLYLDLDTPFGHMASMTVWPNRTDGQHQIVYDTYGMSTVTLNQAEREAYGSGS